VLTLAAATLVESGSPSECCKLEKRGLAWGASSSSVTSLDHAGPATSRTSTLQPRPTTRLVGPSSPGVPFSFRVLPTRPAAHLSMPGTSPGVLSASAHSGGGVYVASAVRTQPASYVPSSGFRTLSTASSSTHLPPPFGEGNARAVLPTGSSPLEQAQELSLPGFPSWRSSLDLASLRLERRESGAHNRFP
jgi:hypothetical protein